MDINSMMKHSFNNFLELKNSVYACCYFCESHLNTTDIVEFINEHNDGKTGICPLCGIDSLIGDASNLPIDDITFVSNLHDAAFYRKTPKL